MVRKATSSSHGSAGGRTPKHRTHGGSHARTRCECHHATSFEGCHHPSKRRKISQSSARSTIAPATRITAPQHPRDSAGMAEPEIDAVSSAWQTQPQVCLATLLSTFRLLFIQQRTNLRPPYVRSINLWIMRISVLLNDCQALNLQYNPNQTFR
jgi:hypothetical protein